VEYGERAYLADAVGQYLVVIDSHTGFRKEGHIVKGCTHIIVMIAIILAEGFEEGAVLYVKVFGGNLIEILAEVQLQVFLVCVLGFPALYYGIYPLCGSLLVLNNAVYAYGNLKAAQDTVLCGSSEESSVLFVGIAVAGYVYALYARIFLVKKLCDVRCGLRGEESIYVYYFVLEHFKHLGESVKVGTGLAAGYHYVFDIRIRNAAKHVQGLIQGGIHGIVHEPGFAEGALAAAVVGDIYVGCLFGANGVFYIVDVVKAIHQIVFLRRCNLLNLLDGSSPCADEKPL